MENYETKNEDGLKLRSSRIISYTLLSKTKPESTTLESQTLGFDYESQPQNKTLKGDKFSKSFAEENVIQKIHKEKKYLPGKNAFRSDIVKKSIIRGVKRYF